MKIFSIAAMLVAGATLSLGAPTMAQTVHETKVHTDTKMSDGVATTTRKVVHVSKRKTRHPKKILGVKVGHKTAVHKTVKTTSVSSNGDASTTVKTSH